MTLFQGFGIDLTGHINILNYLSQRKYLILVREPG